MKDPLYTGQKYCRILQGEHSAILSTLIKLPVVIKTFVMPRHDNGRGIKCYPCPSVRLSKRLPLSKSNTFDLNFMKLGHIG